MQPTRLVLFALETVDGRTQIRPVRELSESETEAYRAAAREFYLYASWQFSIRVVEENYRELLFSLGELADFRPKLDPKLEMASVLHLGINRRLGNFLSSARLFLDHTETRLKRRYGKQSQEVASFKKATAKEYDGCFAYRFLYRLRNYAQHCGMPVGSIEHSAKAEATGDTYRLEYWFDAHHLVSEGAELWGQLENELSSGPAQLSVRQLVDEAMAALKRVDDAVFSIEHPALQSAANQITAIIDAARGPGVMPQVGHIEGDENNATIVFEDVPLTLMAAAGFIRLNTPSPQAAG